MVSFCHWLWLEREVRASVSNVQQGVQEYVMRNSRTSPEAGAFKYESRFEVRITDLINSSLWPLYFFRFVCVNRLDSFYKFLFPSHCCCSDSYD
jgi:hypothetical protein